MLTALGAVAAGLAGLVAGLFLGIWLVEQHVA